MARDRSVEDEEYDVDIKTGRRVELRLANDLIMTLQYFPEFDNISMAFYSRNNPGFVMGMPTADWPRVQEFIAGFQWRGRKQ
jgi:hypothetical protein